jgi:hypothetical protein
MIYDQVNRVADVKAKKGQTTKLEEIDGGGFAQIWAQDTYVNVVTIPIPEALFRLSQGERSTRSAVSARSLAPTSARSCGCRFLT